MAGAREIPVFIVTPPSEDGPTSTVSIMMTRHWGLWASGALRKLDRTNAKGENYWTSGDDDIELVELLPRNDPPAVGGRHIAEGKHRPIAAHDRPFATAPVNKGILERRQGTKERGRDRIREAPQEQFVNNNGDHSSVSESERLIFCKNHLAVLESIKFRGEMMHAFEKECKKPWFNADEFEDDLPPLLPPTRHIRIKAEELLKEFAENPIADVRDLLVAGRQRKTSVCKAWHGVPEIHEQENGRSPLFEPIVDLVTVGGMDDWKDDNCQAWEDIMA
ncbi:uncharacterized protein A1O5_10148 [Cladophialophora psammophila CBS 110553]|uniref:Uncharacterized protein n=1 Tax=Cladophialophora psammophila CBS 110553 TaxID=1182543 RepID=W9WGB7_9EURO|nr:uncharacterized protein A1O5_10148 [Cladophialophora psammophila CBS 110553]EXJ66953.1 hypothetical protein A1O5_10148 [Cladophialophora psammophila CBS 110553]